MPNKVYIKKNIPETEDTEEVSKQLDEEAKKRMKWGYIKDRSKKKEQPKE